MASEKTLQSCLVQLLLPSLLPQLPSPAQTRLRLLRFSISTHLKLLVRIQHRRASGGKDPCWTGNQSTATTLNTPPGMSKAFSKGAPQQTGCQKAAAKVRNSRFPLATASSFPREQPATLHPSLLTFSLASDTKGLSMLRHESICSCSSRE